MCDVIFLCGPAKERVHFSKLLCCASSKYFNTLFLGQFKPGDVFEGRCEVVSLEEISAKAFTRAMKLRFHRDDPSVLFDVEWTDLVETWLAAEYLQLDVSEVIEDHIKGLLQSEMGKTVCARLLTGFSQYATSGALESLCLSHALDHFGSINHKDLSLETITSLVKDESLRCSEKTAFDGCVSYLSGGPNRMESEGIELLQNVRYPLMSPSDIKG